MLTPRELAMLNAVHRQAGRSRADLARDLGLGSGAAAELVANLSRARLVAERDAVPTGRRGRPTRTLVPHPRGPLVLAVGIAHRNWQLEVVQLGGTPVASRTGRHRSVRSERVIGAIRDAIEGLDRPLLRRVHGVGVSAPGTVLDERWVDAANLAWQHVDLTEIWLRAPLLVADNDATLAALAEARRGRARGAALALHVRIDAGLGGALVDHDRIVAGSRGIAGEFGHMPLGNRAVRCACGAHGCWGTSVDGTALARLLGDPEPRDPFGYTSAVLRRMSDGGRAESAAVARVAVSLGRGLAGLVNALDPDIVTLGGSASEIHTAAESSLAGAYTAALMSSRRAEPVRLVAGALGERGPIVGAAERAWDKVWERL